MPEKFTISLKAARVNKGFSQKLAAEKLGISVSTLRSYEQCKTVPDVFMSKRLEKLYDVPEDYIFFWQGYRLESDTGRRTTMIIPVKVTYDLDAMQEVSRIEADIPPEKFLEVLCKLAETHPDLLEKK